MESSFAGKVVAITGAASGIGRATAHLLAARGALLALADLNETGLASVAAEVDEIWKQESNSGGKVMSGAALPPSKKTTTTVLDVRSQEACQAWTTDAITQFGKPLYGAANLAGIIGPSIAQERGSIRNISNEEFDFVMSVHVKGTLNCMRAQLPAMTLPAGASVVNAASISGLVGVELNVPYVAAKHAIVGMTRTAAKEEGVRGVRVNAIAPGIIATPMIRDIEEAKGSTQLFGAGDPGAMGRKGTPEEVAHVIVFLLSSQSSFVNGVVIPVDGGWIC